MPASTQRVDLLHKRLQRFTKMLHVVDRDDVRALHQTRVASRRLREVLPVLQLDADVVDKLTRRLRKVTRRLGKVRELDVLSQVLDELKAGGRHSEVALARVSTGVAEARSKVRNRSLTKGQVRELRRIGEKLEKIERTLNEEDGQKGATRAKSLGELRSCRWAVQARVGRRASTLSRTIASAGTVYLHERLHEVRIALKKLRYALELDAELANIRSSPDLRQLRRAQNTLGRLHDLQVLLERTREVQASLTPPDLNVWRELDSLVSSLEDECRHLHGRYMHDAPALTALTARLSGRTADSKSVRVKLRS